ncbi:MAG: hypothetical protein HOD11_15885 [Candidatus Marinimicrobia bacterium]|jgi:hypothetical protein|nr:hypothetical protein [Candidatus Neomarinimicrobiota bacterium]
MKELSGIKVAGQEGLNLFFNCRRCSHINPSEMWYIGNNGQVICPHCHSSGCNDRWPDNRIVELFESIIDLPLEYREYSRVSCVLYHAAVRSLIENQVRTIAFEGMLYEEVGHIVDMVIHERIELEKLIDLFGQFTATSFGESIRGASKNDFMKHLAWASESRDQLLYAHGSSSGTLIEFDIQWITYALQAFSKLNNSILPGSEDNYLSNQLTNPN